ncbi:MAG TPA: hypothetical protein GXX19_09060 [Syntrophomonadaceae bacterium]|nr:hypothetical protein [Syntrophomonadaceae bacterium]
MTEDEVIELARINKAELWLENRKLKKYVKDLIYAINAAVRWFEGESELGGVQRWQIEAYTGGKAAYLRLKKALTALEKGVG